MRALTRQRNVKTRLIELKSNNKNPAHEHDTTINVSDYK